METTENTATVRPSETLTRTQALRHLIDEMYIAGRISHEDHGMLVFAVSGGAGHITDTWLQVISARDAFGYTQTPKPPREKI